MLIVAMVHFRLDYGNAVLAGLPAYLPGYIAVFSRYLMRRLD